MLQQLESVLITAILLWPALLSATVLNRTSSCDARDATRRTDKTRVARKKKRKRKNIPSQSARFVCNHFLFFLSFLQSFVSHWPHFVCNHSFHIDPRKTHTTNAICSHWHVVHIDLELIRQKQSRVWIRKTFAREALSIWDALLHGLNTGAVGK